MAGAAVAAEEAAAVEVDPLAVAAALPAAGAVAAVAKPVTDKTNPRRNLCFSGGLWYAVRLDGKADIRRQRDKGSAN